MLRRIGRYGLIKSREISLRLRSAGRGALYADQRRALAARWPTLGDRAAWQNARQALQPHHDRYVRTVSTPAMAVSLDTAILLHLLCVDARPRRLIDLGSGFSSFVLRRYAKGSGAAVTSVDDNAAWLERTVAYLAEHQLSTERVLPWDDFVAQPAEPFDLVFYDFSSMPIRRQNLARALDWGAGGIVVLDDLHKDGYADATRMLLDQRPDLVLLPAEGHTADRLGRHAGVVVPRTAVP